MSNTPEMLEMLHPAIATNAASATNATGTVGTHDAPTATAATHEPPVDHAEAEEQCEYVSSTCGAVTVMVRKPSAAEVMQGIRASTQAIERLWARLQQPGITLEERADVPTYTDDPNNAGRIYRKLNGKIEAGFFLDGEFRLEAKRL